ncbi:MAG: hypothetical protein WC222_08055 [Parachlamydiales bacterium]|jgi:hypothetical protein
MQYVQIDMFFGFPVDEHFSAALKSLDPRMIDLYVQEGEAYLQSIENEGNKYLGKPVGPITETSTLELLQLNIYSILKKLVPNFPYETTPLQLVPIVHSLEK